MISIIIPLFNKLLSIKKTIDSILEQEFEDYEIIVIDDGSTDGSANVVLSIKDQRIRFFKQNNLGPSAARNKGIKEAQYDWILFLDADDILLPGALEHLYKLISKYKEPDIFWGNFYLEYKGHRNLYSRHIKEGVIKNNFKEWVLKRCEPRAGSAIFKRKNLLTDLFNENFWRYEDTEFIFRIMRKYKIYRSKKNLMVYICDNAEASTKRNIETDFLGQLDLNKDLFWERMALYELILHAKKDYQEEAIGRYRNIYYRIDFKIYYWIIKLYSKGINKLYRLYEDYFHWN